MGLQAVFRRVTQQMVLGGLSRRFIDRPRIKALALRHDTVPAFESVCLELRTRCNGRCEFCPAAVQHETRPDLHMPDELFLKIVAELASLGFGGRLAFHVNSDPLLSPRLPELVAHARARLPAAWLQILTNGQALTVPRARALVEGGINELSINYAGDGGAPPPARLLRVRDEVTAAAGQRRAVEGGVWSTGRSRAVLLFNLRPRRSRQVLSSRGGNAPNKPAPASCPEGFCEYPFSTLNITTDGRVSKCCSDVYFEDPMGNANEQRLQTIWSGAPFRRVRAELLQGRRRHLRHCRACDQRGIRQMGRLGRVVALLSR